MSIGPNLHYYSEQFKLKLARLQDTSAAILEAPSGYGKTTALQDYFRTSVTNDSEIIWITAVDESPVALYRRLCHALEKVDSRVGKRLLAIDLPNAFTVGDACDVLLSMECSQETWLVIDNFHLLCDTVPEPFLVALLRCGGNGLCVVVVSQMLTLSYHTAIASCQFLHVTTDDLQLRAADIRDYFAFAGIGLTKTEAQEVFELTGGWAIAVYLQLCTYQETSAFSDTTTLQLMERLIWDKATSEQKKLFLLMSPFESLTIRQIGNLLNCKVLPGYANGCLSAPFIRYDFRNQRYELHDMLSRLLVQKRSESDPVFECECLRRAGNLCRDEDRISDAMVFYARIEDWDCLLSLDFSHLIFEQIGNRSFFEVALDIFRKCPIEVRVRHPLSMLRVAWALRASDQRSAFVRVMEELDRQLDHNGLLRAEWLLLSSYCHFPRLDKMLPLVEKATLLFSGTCSRVILPEAPWAFGNHSQLGEFHRKPGYVDREADSLEVFISLYTQITNGHGSGADALFRAECAFYQGDLINTEIFSYRAAYLAKNDHQRVIHLSAMRLLAELAFLKADVVGWQHAVASMKRIATCPEQNSYLFRAVMDTVCGILLCELSLQGHVADWIKEGTFRPSSLPPSMVNNALYVHLLCLLLDGEYARMIGTVEAIPQDVAKKTSFSELLLFTVLAVAFVSLGDRERARDCLRSAFQKALPDRFLYPIASIAVLLQGIAEELIEQEYPEIQEDFDSMKGQFALGLESLLGAMLSGKTPSDLTVREREIALLAAEGLHNGEIAKRLFLSESTVRSHLRTIFQKLDIDRRAKLIRKLDSLGLIP